MKSRNEWRPETAEVFGDLFVLEKTFERLMDRVLQSDNLTSRQWFVLAVVARSSEAAPSLKDVARTLNTSHQNVKAIALNLEKRGFLRLERDHKDARVTRLILTDLHEEFWAEREQTAQQFIARLFRCLDVAEMDELGGLIRKLIDDCKQQETEEV